MPSSRKNSHRWTPQEQDVIRRDYRGNWESLEQIAGNLRVTPYAVKGQVSKLGLARQDKGRRWTLDEDEYLRSHITKRPVAWIAKQMHRSVNAVSIRAQRLGLTRRCRDGWYAKTDVMAILGVDHHWVQKRIDSGKMIAVSHFPGNTPGQTGLCPWHITETSLRDYIITYPEELTGRNVDVMAIVDILTAEKL